MASVIKQGKNKFRAFVRTKGHNISRTFTTKLEALSWATETEHSLATGNQILQGKTSVDLFDRYAREESVKKKGARWEQIRLTKLSREKWAKLTLQALQLQDIQSWVDQSNLAPNSIRRERNLLSAVYKKGVKWRWVASSPLNGLELPKAGPPRDRLISDREVGQVLKALQWDPEAKRRGNCWEIAWAFQFAIETAMRLGEIYKLQWQNVILERNYCKIYDTKNGEDREIPLSVTASELLELVGPKQFGSVLHGNKGSAGVQFRRKLKQAGIEDLHFHDTRHEACTRLAGTFHILELRRITGHKDINMLWRYFNETAEQMAEKMR